jgi:hypothetical protein
LFGTDFYLHTRERLVSQRGHQVQQCIHIQLLWLRYISNSLRCVGLCEVFLTLHTPFCTTTFTQLSREHHMIGPSSGTRPLHNVLAICSSSNADIALVVQRIVRVPIRANRAAYAFGQITRRKSLFHIGRGKIVNFPTTPINAEVYGIVSKQVRWLHRYLKQDEWVSGTLTPIQIQSFFYYIKICWS